jgi:uncharacterized protein (UPF0332 family)
MASQRTSKDLKKLAKTYMARSHERLRSATLLLDAGLYRDSVSRSYYAVLDAADALLLTKDIRPKSHTGTITLVGAHFIRTGKIDARYGRLFRVIQRARMTADYERDQEIGREEAVNCLRDAEGFVKLVETLLQQFWPDKR